MTIFFFLTESTLVTHAACVPLAAAQSEPDGWLLLAALVVCTAGRLAAHPRR
ncbi:hypothetical protein [Massilia sp. 9I]|uniref:hypothetical protein n=1 Tax=Massilia sp. 9I TaxID=2653152 RepID=UPI0012F382DA|nr:hypothetical protein [Massilia sp. 9I]VXC23753.1 hypothetical protein MASSI9I_60016 [Massilia sp. 9I]